MLKYKLKLQNSIYNEIFLRKIRLKNYFKKDFLQILMKVLKIEIRNYF